MVNCLQEFLLKEYVSPISMFLGSIGEGKIFFLLPFWVLGNSRQLTRKTNKFIDMYIAYT